MDRVQSHINKQEKGYMCIHQSITTENTQLSIFIATFSTSSQKENSYTISNMRPWCETTIFQIFGSQYSPQFKLIKIVPEAFENVPNIKRLCWIHMREINRTKKRTYFQIKA